MHHAAATNLEPPGAFADGAAGTVAEDAANEHLGAGFRVGEEAWPNLDFRVRLEQLAREGCESALQIPHGHVLSDDETLDLLEHRRVCQVEIIATVHLARHDDPHRRLVA